MVQHHVAVKMIVLKNNVLGMVREYQHYTYKDKYSVIDLTGSPNLEKIAEAYELPFIRVENMKQAEEAIDRFLNTEGSVLMECLIDPMDLVK
jgi:acetolactate synthase-1/2/3 large subunit